MPISVLLHISGEEAVVGEIEELPGPNDTNIILNNPRRRDDKELPYLAETVVSVIWPMHRVTFIEVLPTREEEELIGFVLGDKSERSQRTRLGRYIGKQEGRILTDRRIHLGEPKRNVNTYYLAKIDAAEKE